MLPLGQVQWKGGHHGAIELLWLLALNSVAIFLLLLRVVMPILTIVIFERVMWHWLVFLEISSQHRPLRTKCSQV